MSKKSTDGAQGSKERSVLELRFPSEKRYLHMVHQLTSQLAVTTGFEESEAEKIAMAVDEATTNVIQHAYHGDTDQEVEIHYDPEGDSHRILRTDYDDKPKA